MLLERKVFSFLYGWRLRLVLFHDDTTSGFWICCFNLYLTSWCSCSCGVGRTLQKSASEGPLLLLICTVSHLVIPDNFVCIHMLSSCQLSTLSLGPANTKRKTLCVVWTSWASLVFHSLIYLQEYYNPKHVDSPPLDTL